MAVRSLAGRNRRGVSRRRFLAGLAGFGSGAAATGANGRKAAAATLRPVTILAEAFLAGMACYDFPHGPGDEIRAGQPLVLRREPDNPHDERAIEVFLPDGRKLGYVARAENEALARLMDAGVPARAKVKTAGTGPYSVTMRIDVLLPCPVAGA